MEPLIDHVRFVGPRQVLRLKDANHRVTLLDEEAKIDGRAAVLKTAEVFSQVAPVDREMVMIEEDFFRLDRTLVLRRNGPAFARDLAGDALRQFAHRAVVDQQ